MSWESHEKVIRTSCSHSFANMSVLVCSVRGLVIIPQGGHMTMACLSGKGHRENKFSYHCFIVSNRLIVLHIVHGLVFYIYHSNMYWMTNFIKLYHDRLFLKPIIHQFCLFVYVTFLIDWMTGLFPDMAWFTAGLSTGWITDQSVW